MPEPLARSSFCRSNTVTLQPVRARAAAVASPPRPPPAMIAVNALAILLCLCRCIELEIAVSDSPGQRGVAAPGQIDGRSACNIPFAEQAVDVLHEERTLPRQVGLADDFASRRIQALQRRLELLLVLDLERGVMVGGGIAPHQHQRMLIAFQRRAK